MRRRSKLRSLFIALFLLLIAFIACAWWYWNTHKVAIVREKINSALEEGAGGLYAMSYDEMKLNELAGDLKLKNVQFGWDAKKLDSLERSGAQPPILMKLSAQELQLSGIKTFKALEGKEIVGKKLHIKNPVIRVYYKNSRGENSGGNEVYDQLRGGFEHISIDTLEISDARIVAINRSTADSFVMNHTDLLFNGLHPDTVKTKTSSRTGFNCKRIGWRDPSGFYQYVLNDLKVDANNKAIHIGSAEVCPEFDEFNFMKRQRTQVDRVEIKFTGITIAGIDFEKLEGEIFDAGKLQIDETNIRIYRDLRIPRDSINRNGNYPHQQIMRLPVKFRITEAQLPEMYIEYKEVGELSGRPGTVRYTHTRIEATNLTNDSASIRKNNICHVQINGSLLDLTPVSATLELSLSDTSGKFFVTGEVGGGDATKLTELTEPMGMTRIKSGTVDGLRFNITGTNTQASGTVIILYKDLVVELLEVDKHKPGGVDRKDISSFMGNLMIKDNNPVPGHPVRTATVQHDRDMNRSFYNLVWKTLFDGINQTIGNKQKFKP